MKNIEELKKEQRMIIQALGEDGGCCKAFIPTTKKPVQVIFSFGGGWDHVSASLRERCLTWDEMCMIKSMFFNDTECVIQYHPPKEQYVNIHEHVLHLWKPQTLVIPMPPMIFV